jgi:hypothetical protein
VAAPAAVAPIVPEPPAPVRAASVAPPMPEPPAPVRPAAVAAAAPVVPEPPAPMRAVSMAPVIPAASSIVQHAAPVPPPAPVPEPRPAVAAAPPVAHIAAVPAATVVDTRAHAAPAFVEPTAAPVPASRAAVPPVVPHVGTPFTPFAPEPSGFDAAPAVPSAPAAPAAVPATGESAFAHTPDITELLKDFPGVVSNEAHEDDFAAAAPAPVARRFDRKQLMRLAAAVLVIAALGGGGWVYARSRGKGAVPATGTLSVQTNPPGVAVFVDGVSRGNTPARISVTAGSHIVELRGRGVPRVIPVQVTAGAEMSQYLEIPETPSTGSLLVQSDPAGARVTIDGVERGTAPLSVADLEPGDHEVVLVGSAGTPVKQHVVIQAGVTSSVLAPVSTATPGPVSGWLAVKAPVTIEIHEGGRLIGTTDSDKIMLAAGRHELQLVNDTLGYSAKRVVQVPAGKTLPLAIEMPQGTINLNATPWAEVWIDGRRVGETPIGNLSIPIGPHEVVFRHPQFGEKHQAISVTLSAPVRLSIDMK